MQNLVSTCGIKIVSFGSYAVLLVILTSEDIDIDTILLVLKLSFNSGFRLSTSMFRYMS